MSRPSLQEIADMPHSAGLAAVRGNYDPQWAKPIAEGSEERTFRVRVAWTVSGYSEIEVEADTPDEAQRRARDDFEWDPLVGTPDYVDVDRSEVLGDA